MAIVKYSLAAVQEAEGPAYSSSPLPCSEIWTHKSRTSVLSFQSFRDERRNQMTEQNLQIRKTANFETRISGETLYVTFMCLIFSLAIFSDCTLKKYCEKKNADYADSRSWMIILTNIMNISNSFLYLSRSLREFSLLEPAVTLYLE